MIDPRTPPQAAPAGFRNDDVRLADLLAVLRREWRIVAAVTGFTTTAAIIAAFLMTPIYRAETLLSPISDERESSISALAGQLGGLAALAGMQVGGGSSKDEAVATLSARAFTEAFIRDEELLPIIYDEQWDEAQGSWKESDPENQPTVWKAAERFARDIRQVSVDKKTGLVTLAIEWKDPRLASDWANKIVQRANAQLRARAIGEARKSLAYLNGELLASSVVEVRQAIFNLIEAQTKKIMIANVREDYAFRVVDPAVPPERKVKPKRILMTVLGLMIGGMLGALAAFWRSAAHGRN